MTAWRMELRREAAKCEPLTTADTKQKPRTNWIHYEKVLQAREIMNYPG
jgi:hypothetical protein